MFINKHERKIMSNKRKLLFLEKIADGKSSRDEIKFNLINALKKHGWKCDEETNNFQKKYVEKLKENSND